VEVQNQIRTYIQQHLMAAKGGGEVKDDDPLLDSGIIDSMGILELVSYLESTFGIEVRDEEVVPANFHSIERIASLVTTKRATVSD